MEQQVERAAVILFAIINKKPQGHQFKSGPGRFILFTWARSSAWLECSTDKVLEIEWSTVQICPGPFILSNEVRKLIRVDKGKTLMWESVRAHRYNLIV